MPKFVSIEEAVKLIPDGASIMFGGFMGCGNAHKFIDALSKSGVKDLTMICNDGSMPGGPMGEDYYGVAKLIHNKQVKKLIATHVGLNPEVATQSMQDGTLEVVLIPQGSLAEMIRADGAGLGGVLTPTGVGTIVEDNPYCLGKQTINGKDYLLMAACLWIMWLREVSTNGKVSDQRFYRRPRGQGAEGRRCGQPGHWPAHPGSQLSA